MSERGPGALERRWAWLRAQQRIGLIPYLTAGFPSRAATLDALHMLVDEGADILEVGVPFSDPLADGPIIQRASFAALERGMTLHGVLSLIAEAAPAVPVVLFSYLNPLLRYGLDAFLRDARAAGCSGLLLTDVPAGADPAVEAAVRDSGLDRIPLVAPTTTAERLGATVAAGSGFVYLISRLGVTGARTAIGAHIGEIVQRVRAVSALPVAVGFGIATGAQAAAIGRIADGVVVGSALVERMERDPSAARALVVELRRALDGVPVEA